MTEWGKPREVQSDDLDIDDVGGYRLSVFMGGNGDWYVTILKPSDRLGPCVRLATSGGASALFPGLPSAMAKVYRALGSVRELSERISHVCDVPGCRVTSENDQKYCDSHEATLRRDSNDRTEYVIECPQSGKPWPFAAHGREDREITCSCGASVIGPHRYGDHWVVPPHGKRDAPGYDTPGNRPRRINRPPGACECCPRAGEYNGFGSDGPLKFKCPKGCPCHD